MQTARIPWAILLALELGGAAACTTSVGPCLSPPPPEDESQLGPCLMVAEDPEVTPCLSPEPEPDPPVGRCLEMPPPDPPPPPPKDPPEIGPCLKVSVPDDEPRLTPCLRVAPPQTPPVQPCLSMPPPTKPPPADPSPSTPNEDPGETARATVIDKLADTLPPDVLAKLRKRDA